MNSGKLKLHFYWDQGFDCAPELVKRNIAIWEKIYPSDSICLYERCHAESALDELGVDYKNISLATKSDFFRLYILSKKGGVWIDSTVLPGPNVKAFLGKISNQHFFVFRDPGKDRIISSWLIFSDKDNRLVNEWLDAMVKSFSWGGLQPISERGIVRKAIIYGLLKVSPRGVSAPWVLRMTQSYPYFVLHYAFDRLINKDPSLKVAFEEGQYYSAGMAHLLQHSMKKNDFSGRTFEELNGLYKSSPVHKLDWKAGNIFSPVLEIAEKTKFCN